ncbi:response regulator [Halolactibacillus sp. JCM 19043]|uniref:response regulator n=1 Tax=Halolactibacillus sp. JCM 19043 TaxID=1460638 RepID=UPI0007837536|nr:response regulator [Halolactibacillus sp. JCM 19043]
MKLLLLDDERMAIEHMKYLLNKSEVIKSVSMTSFLSPTDALKWMEDNIVDVIFIDIEMPEMDGLVVANKMKDIQPNLEIVFVTAFQEYAVEAFELHALDYLLKPVRLQRMDQTLLRIERRLQEKVNEQITLSSTQSIHLLGKVSIESSGQPIDFKWRKGRVKELFLLLLHSRHRAMSKFDIIDYIWSDLSDKKASTQLHMTIYRLRQIINTFNLDLSIEFQDEAYQMLLGKTATVDVDRWLDHINHYPTIHSDNLDHAIDALSLVKGDYMQNLEYSWAQNEQVYLKNSYLKRLIDIASFD